MWQRGEWSREARSALQCLAEGLPITKALHRHRAPASHSNGSFEQRQISHEAAPSSRTDENGGTSDVDTDKGLGPQPWAALAQAALQCDAEQSDEASMTPTKNEVISRMKSCSPPTPISTNLIPISPMERRLSSKNKEKAFPTFRMDVSFLEGDTARHERDAVEVLERDELGLIDEEVVEELLRWSDDDDDRGSLPWHRCAVPSNGGVDGALDVHKSTQDGYPMMHAGAIISGSEKSRDTVALRPSSSPRSIGGRVPEEENFRRERRTYGGVQFHEGDAYHTSDGEYDESLSRSPDSEDGLDQTGSAVMDGIHKAFLSSARDAERLLAPNESIRDSQGFPANEAGIPWHETRNASASMPISSSEVTSSHPAEYRVGSTPSHDPSCLSSRTRPEDEEAAALLGQHSFTTTNDEDARSIAAALAEAQRASVENVHLLKPSEPEPPLQQQQGNGKKHALRYVHDGENGEEEIVMPGELLQRTVSKGGQQRRNGIDRSDVDGSQGEGLSLDADAKAEKTLSGRGIYRHGGDKALGSTYSSGSIEDVCAQHGPRSDLQGMRWMRSEKDDDTRDGLDLRLASSLSLESSSYSQQEKRKISEEFYRLPFSVRNAPLLRVIPKFCELLLLLLL